MVLLEDVDDEMAASLLAPPHAVLPSASSSRRYATDARAASSFKAPPHGELDPRNGVRLVMGDDDGVGASLREPPQAGVTFVIRRHCATDLEVSAVPGKGVEQNNSRDLRQQQSQVDVAAINNMAGVLQALGHFYLLDVFRRSMQPINMAMVRRGTSFAACLGAPMPQIVPGTCSIISPVMCIEAYHRFCYEGRNGRGSFNCAAAHPFDLLYECRRHMIWKTETNSLCPIWTDEHGAYVGHVLDMIMKMGGVAVNGGQGFPSRLQITGWEQHSGQELTENRMKELFNTRGLFIGTLWYMPWYALFDANQDENLTYHSGCARDKHLQERARNTFNISSGFHSVVCFKYDDYPGGMRVKIFDNHTDTGPERYVHYKEIEFIYTISIDVASSHMGVADMDIDVAECQSSHLGVADMDID